jgi:hypothetical protein
VIHIEEILINKAIYFNFENMTVLCDSKAKKPKFWDIIQDSRRKKIQMSEGLVQVLACIISTARPSLCHINLSRNNTCSQNGPTYVKGAAGVAASSPFLGPSTEIITIYAMLNPPALTTDILSKIAVTEIIVLAFPSFMASTEHRELAA